MIGATNVLFVQKKGLADVVIEIDKDRFDVQDPELKKALHLTTEDLRFTDNLVKHVSHQTQGGRKQRDIGGQIGFACLVGKFMTPCQENAILFRSSQHLPRPRLEP